MNILRLYSMAFLFYWLGWRWGHFRVSNTTSCRNDNYSVDHTAYVLIYFQYCKLANVFRLKRQWLLWLASTSVVYSFYAKPLGLITVFGVILTGRQSGQKLHCLYGNPMANNVFPNWMLCNFQNWMLCNFQNWMLCNFKNWMLCN